MIPQQLDVITTGAARQYMPVGSGGGLIARYTANPSGVFGDGYMYLGTVIKNLNTYYGQIWVNNGSWLILSSLAISPTNTMTPGFVTGTLTFKVIGSSMSLYFNNIKITSVVNLTLPGYGGLGVRSLGSGCVFDDFQASSISNYNRSNTIDQNYVNWGLLRVINQNNISGWGG